MTAADSRADSGADAETGSGHVLAVVPVEEDDPTAPHSRAALRRLHGRPLLRRVVDALAGSGGVDGVVVALASDGVAEVAAQVAQALDGLDRLDGLDGEVSVVRVEGCTPQARLQAVLRDRASAPAVVVVHDPRAALAPAALVRSVVDTLASAGPAVAGVVPVRPVTDTLKRVDPDDVLTGTVDREGFRVVGHPQAYRTAALLDALGAVDGATGADPDVLPGLVLRRGARLLTVPAPAEDFLVATAEDLLLAEAILDVDDDAALPR